MDNIAHFFLLFTDLKFMLPLVILGFLFINRDIFYQAALISLFSMILNLALKVTFQVPLPPFLHKAGFAFPSGHMQLACVFYLWLGLQFRLIGLRILIVMILAGIGFGLIHLGYHTIFDVMGSVITAGLIIWGYYALNKRYPSKTPVILASLASLAMLYIAFRYHIPMFAWVVYASLIGLICAQQVFIRLNK